MDKEVAWIRNSATDSQIEGILKQRDGLIKKYAVAIKVLEDIMQLISDGDLIRNTKQDNDYEVFLRQALKISDAIKNANGILLERGEK